MFWKVCLDFYLKMELYLRPHILDDSLLIWLLQAYFFTLLFSKQTSFSYLMSDPHRSAYHDWEIFCWPGSFSHPVKVLSTLGHT